MNELTVINKKKIRFDEGFKENYSIFRKWESFENYVCGVDEQCEAYCKSIKTLDDSWKFHFTMGLEFSYCYYKYWIEKVTELNKTNPNTEDTDEMFAGYNLVISALKANALGDKAYPPMFVGEAIAAYVNCEKDILKEVFEGMYHKTNRLSTESLFKLLTFVYSACAYFIDNKMLYPQFNIEMWETLTQVVLETSHYELNGLFISTLYQLFPTLNGDSRKEFIKYLFKNEIFEGFFCNWSYHVRLFFHELIMYRMTICPSWDRIKSGRLLDFEKETYKRMNNKDFNSNDYDKKVLSMIDKKIKSLQKKSESPPEKQTREQRLYLKLSLEEYEDEYKDYVKWQASNKVELKYKILDISRLNTISSKDD